MSKAYCVAVALMLVMTSAHGAVVGIGLRSTDCSTGCTPAQCNVQKCDLSVPYACVAGPAAGGCSSTPSHFENTTQCTACCDISSCSISCGPCDAAACASNPCPSRDPYLCTKGSDKGGCAPSSGTWSNNPGCKACCDASQCVTNKPTPAPTPSIVPLNCNVSCGSMCKNSKRCPFNAPFMCTAGAEVDGCAKKDIWTGPGCTACCDVTLCPDVPCGSCSSSVCQSTECSASNPYICTSGTLNGGCSPSSNYWPENPDCNSCCNYNTCPGGSGSN